jgi:hypothetical protein
MAESEEKPEEKFKTLINVGIILSCMLIIGIFIAIGWVINNDDHEPDPYALQLYRDSMQAANNVATYPYDYDYYNNDPGDYYDYGPGPKERENDSLNDEIRKSYVFVTQEDLLDHLDKESDKCAHMIHELIVAFQDTLKKPGVSKTATTSIAFFNSTQQDENLFTALFIYRETTEELASDASIYSYLEYRNYFPLMETSDYGYIKSWDKSQFEQDPDAVITYLERLEMDLRYYESQMLWDMAY